MKAIEADAIPAVLSTVADHVAAAKPRITAMAVVAVAAGFYLAAGRADAAAVWPTLLAAIGGMVAVVAGANAVNQVLEHRHDARMLRTANRPVASGRLAGERVMRWALPLSAVGVAVLAACVNLATAGLAAAAWLLYVVVYTPLKRRTPLSVYVGAVPGALPPVIGWAAAGGSIGLPAGTLFALMFVWQLPHFFAIAWMYRDDYANAGYRVLPVVDPTGRRMVAAMIGYSLLLIPTSLLPTYVGLCGTVYYFGALVLGLAFLAFSVEVVRLRTRASAAQHLFVSLAYLTLVFVLMTFDRSVS